MKPTVVVLGASGRLGHRLLPLFSAAGFATIGVTRAAAVMKPEGVRWIIADLTNPEDRRRVAVRVGARIRANAQVCIVDAVLDRRGVDAMRQSIQGATDTVLLLNRLLVATAAKVSVLAASTTAVLAPGLYQTPYGLAKRRQVVTYARAGVAGAALLLPVLGEDMNGGAPQVSFFDEAAHRLAATATACGNGFTIYVPELASAMAVGHRAARPPLARTVFLAHVRSLVVNRDSMWAHRDAARGRLRLSPQRLRQRIDHHQAPAELVRRFANRYHVAVIDERINAAARNGEGRSHA